MTLDTRLNKLENQSGLKDQAISFFTWRDSRDDDALREVQAHVAATNGLLFLTSYDAKPIKLGENNDA